MSKFLHHLLAATVLLLSVVSVCAQQVPDSGFEDWSGAAYDGAAQLKNWHTSNVTQVGFKFNFAHKESGRSGSCIMVQQQEVGAMGITETSPGYVALGQPWVYLASVTKINEATAGTDGGVNFTYRPDSMSVWIKRTGSNAEKEDFVLLYYAWAGSSTGNTYKGKNGSCSGVDTHTDEESDIRQATNANDCGTIKKATQVAEGVWRERKSYGQWTNIRVPIYYSNNTAPEKMNIIFSASQYPNYRISTGMYAGNSLYVDDVELIYSSKIQTLYVDGKEWKGFDPNSTEVQNFALGENATAIPSIEARRGSGSVTTTRGKEVVYPGRMLTSKEITVTNGDLVSQPTVITVKSEDGKSTTTYRIQFQKAKSSNAKLAGLTYTYTDQNGTSQTAKVSPFNPSQYNYKVELPYGAKGNPTVAADPQEDGQKVSIAQAGSQTGTATIDVTAPNGQDKAQYKVTFEVGKLADNTLKDITVNGKSIPGFTPNQSTYKVSLPVGTTKMPEIKGVSAYPAGEQTIVYNAPAVIDGGTYTISVTTPGNSVPKVYKLNFKLEASSYTYLKDLKAGNYITSFDPEQMTYYVNLPIGTTALPAVSWTAGDEFQKVEKSDLPSGSLDGTVRVTVTAGNGDQAVYKIVFSTARSEVSTLKGIQIGGVALPDFSPEETSYSYGLPVGTTELPAITWTVGDEYQQVVLTTAGLNGKTRITVTAGNGSTTVYQIAFSVATYSDNTLKGLYLDGKLVDGFAADKEEYWVNLPQGTTALPEVTYELQNTQLQSASERKATSLNGDYKVTVRPQSGASRTYVIHFSVAVSGNVDLKMLYINGTEVEGFSPDVTAYTYKLPEGVSTIPAVTFDKSESSQRVLSVLENKVQTITVTAQSGAKREYTITFIVQVSQNAFLNMIYLDGTPLEGFKKEVLDYKAQLTGTTCPVITVDKAPGQQVTITAPYAAGQATIQVKPEEGKANTYTIDFEQVAAVSVRLADIQINGIGIPGFDPAKPDYTATYEKTLPEITCTSGPDQTVLVRWKDNVAWIYVKDDKENNTAYRITFTRTLTTDNTLLGIYADGVLIDGFDAAKTDYSYSLVPGSTYPELSYKAADNVQVVFFGQVEEGKWDITVVAEDGTSATYSVQYTIQPYSDATLKSLAVEGRSIAFDPNTLDYELSLDEGAVLPKLSVEARPGQTVLQLNANDSLQQVLVFAQSGDRNIYNVKYHRAKSSNALLADIFIDGVSIDGFNPTKFDYVDSLAWRAKIVPNVFPVAQLPNQTITTYFSRPDGVTKIHVEAQDGTANDYTIAFPTHKSANVRLASLALDTDLPLELDFKPNTLDYEVVMPKGAAACPKILYEKAEEEQRIDVVARSLGEKSEITVTAQNGDTRTYTILFKETHPTDPNILTAITIVETKQELDLSDPAIRDFDVPLPFGARTMTVEYKKSYASQTVFVQPGGVYNPTIITVKANRSGEPDEVYTLTPHVSTADPAVLTDISINNVTIEGFSPEQFSYIVPVTAAPIVRYKEAEGTKVNVLEQTEKHWKAEVTYGERVNTYDIWYYYQNDVIPNSELNDWTTAKYNNAPKPAGWNVIADADNEYKVPILGTVTSGGECAKASDGSVYLKTRYLGLCARNIPAFMTLGRVSGEINSTNSFNYSGSITFRNTPDKLTVRYNAPTVETRNHITYELWGSNGYDVIDEGDTESFSKYKERVLDLSAINAKVGNPTAMNIVLNSYYDTQGGLGTEGMGIVAEMNVDWLRFSFNHTLTGATVNGKAASMEGKAFTFTLDNSESENIEKPILAFTGEVVDQAQLLTWDANETVAGDYAVRNVKIRNFAENGTDYTDYTLAVRRPLDTKNELSDLKAKGYTVDGFRGDSTNYVIYVPRLSQLPDMQPVPASSLQKITTEFNAVDTVLTITVTPEKGEATVYTVKFTSPLSSDVTLASITAGTEALDVEQMEHQVAADYMPAILFEKKLDAQKVSVVNGIITVTAENGAKGTYTIVRKDPEEITTSVLTEFSLGMDVLSDLGGATMTKDAAKPDNYISFIREFDRDSVVFVQDEEKMQWQVYGTSGRTYTWNYPSALSSNTDLANLLVDSKDYEGFDKSVTEYELISDKTVIVEAVPTEERQNIVTTVTEIEGGVEYAIEVNPSDKTASKTYKLVVRRPKSSDATLAGILLDDVMIENFDPATKDYTVVIPAPAVKAAQPKMPCVTYLTAHNGQKVTVKPGAMNGDPTTFDVTSEDGTVTEFYSLTVVAEPSHCSDLTGMTVNGVALDHFESGRHFYSLSINTSDIGIDYTSDDRFIHVDTIVETVKADHEYHYTLHVTAEDGTSSDYLVEIYVENRSNDAQLANITLNGKDFVDFERALNSDLSFDGGNNNYDIYLPTGTTVLPEVSAQLKMPGQSVEIHQSADRVLLEVKAVDGTLNTYQLNFHVPLSRNADLSMIYLDGEPLKDFDPSYYFYQIDLPVGVHSIPEVVGQKGEAVQTISATEVDEDKLQATIRVQAEDPSVRENKYVVLFHLTKSAADTLNMIYQDGQPLEGFAPKTMYYTASLPVGTVAFPALSWQEADDWQTVAMDTVENSANTLVRQITVTAENGKKNTYTVSFTIEKSDVDTLQMIFVDQKQLVGFAPRTEEYLYQLTATQAKDLNGQLPVVEFISGDEYQTVIVSQAPESMSGKSLGYKSIVTVTAATGKTRTYTIHYPVELSTETTLNMINLGGQPLPNYDAERFNYKLDIEEEAGIPVVSVVKKEDAQQYEIIVDGDNVYINVTAEDNTKHQTYTLVFQRLKSAITDLRDIILTGTDGNRYPSAVFSYRPDEHSYAIDLDYVQGKTLDELLPDIEPVFYDEMQTADTTVNRLENGDIRVTITVKAPNGEDESEYALHFHLVKPSDATLASLSVNGTEIEGFDPSLLEYEFALPYGTPDSQKITEKAVSYVLSDTEASAVISTGEDGAIRIVVTAQDGTTSLTYILTQTIGLDGDNKLAWITLDGDTLKEFDPETNFYTYYVEASVPKIEAGARSENATVEDIQLVSVGDTCQIICVAADGSENNYFIHFAPSPINTGLEATVNDVLLKRVPNTLQLFAATVRSGVEIALYDQYGHCVFTGQVPTSDPNDVEIVVDSDEQLRLNNVAVNTRSGLYIDVIQGQPYFYVFFAKNRKVASGKIIVY